MGSLLRDFRFALRVLAKAPGFTAAAVIVLALGIGLNTAMFSAAYALAFRPRPFPAPERMVQIYSQNTREQQAASPDVPFVTARTFLEHRDASLERWLLRRVSTIATAFGALAGLIAVIGLYGAKAYALSRRTREIGIRLALGAEPARARGLILREGLGLALFGIVGSLLLGAALARLLGSIIVDLDAFDPAVFGVATLVLLAATLIASWLPARHATRVNPLDALRTESAGGTTSRITWKAPNAELLRGLHIRRSSLWPKRVTYVTPFGPGAGRVAPGRRTARQARMDRLPHEA